MFITIEGPEGSGKSTALKGLVSYFEENNIDYITTREPGGIDIAEQIRKIILSKENTKMDSKTEALLYAAARRQHIVEVVRPALDAGKVVVCDRFVDSSLAYQGVGRGIGIDKVYNMNLFAIDDTMPDLTVFFDISPEEGLKRINADAGREVNRLDIEDLDFHNRVYDGYKKVAQQYKDRIVSIDATKSVEEVKEQLIKAIDAKLKK